jgi:Cu/Zn superoxide dismutase
LRSLAITPRSDDQGNDSRDPSQLSRSLLIPIFSGGTALVIHAKPDDKKTDPSGSAGDRVACGVIAK